MNEHTTRVLDHFTEFLHDLGRGDRPNIEPVMQKYGIKEESPIALMYAGFVAGWYAGVIDMDERPDEIRKELDL